MIAMGFVKRCYVVLALIGMGWYSAFAVILPVRLDMKDAAGNKLLFVEFRYSGSLNIGRTIYMADSTFVRDVAIVYDANGMRVSEVSYNFNGDTVFVSRFDNSTPNYTVFSIEDQFKLDQVGDNVLYNYSNPLDVSLVYQRGSESAGKVVYDTDADGNITTVTVTGSDGSTYTGEFEYTDVGVTRKPASSVESGPVVRAAARGGSLIDLHFNLKRVADVRCELITLSGRCANVLYSGKVEAGSGKKSIRLNNGRSRVANGVYMVVVSVDGVTVSRSKYLHQKTMLGGVK